MSYVDLEMGYVMDESSKEVYKVRDGVMHESTVKEYEDALAFKKKNLSIWSDATEMEEIPETAVEDESGLYIDANVETIDIYRVEEAKEAIEPKILSVSFVPERELEDISAVGLSSRGKFILAKMLNLVDDFVKDGEWHSNLSKIGKNTYKVSYRITNEPVIGFKKITMGAKVSVKPKKKVSDLVDF